MDKQRSILLIEDEADVMAFNSKFFESKGYKVHEATCIAEAQKTLNKVTPDIIILDVYLPDGIGFEFCRVIRETSNIPVIYLTIEDKQEKIVNGLNLGGDDYVIKPYDPEVLNARVEALLRRYRKHSEYKAIKIHPDFHINLISLKAFYKDNDISLSTKEALILARLAREEGRFIPEDLLFKEIWGEKDNLNLKTMMVHTSTLRTKLKVHHIDHIIVERDEKKGLRLNVQESQW